MMSKMSTVELQERREELIITLLDLQDVSYQEHEWFKKDNNKSFDFEFVFIIEFFEDLFLYKEDNKAEIAMTKIGAYLKSELEAKVLCEVIDITEKLSKEIGKNAATNQQYRNSKFLSPLRKAAAKAFTVFMENEKDNIEFVQFLERLKASRLRKIQQDL